MKRINPQLEELLKIPEETQTVEFKRISGDAVVSKIVKTAVAFTNTDGGRIIIGIDDPEKTKKRGIDRVYGLEENLENYDEVFREFARITPAVRVDKIELNTDKGTVAILTILKSSQSLHSIDGKIYVRLKKSNRQLTPQECIKMSYARGFTKADREVVEVDFALLETGEYEEWRRSRGIDGRIQEVLYKTGLARNENRKLLPTRAAVLLFAEFPTDLMDTKSAIKIMKYTGTKEKIGNTPNMIGVPKIINGPINQQIKQTQEYVLLMLSQGLQIHSGFYTKYSIPERAIKEAIVNAVIHRDYFIKRDIEIKIFEDRIEIVSPGLFPYNITKSNIGLVRADGYRNDLLVKHLREFPSPPNLDQNEGVIAMRNEMKKEKLYPPIFATYPDLADSVKVTLLNEHVPSEWEKVKEYLQQNPYINNSVARELTNTEQVHTMSRMLSKWTEQGLLIRTEEGGSKNAKYRLASKDEASNS